MMDKPFASEAMNNQVMYNEIVAHRKAFTAWSGFDYGTIIQRLSHSYRQQR